MSTSLNTHCAQVTPFTSRNAPSPQRPPVVLGYSPKARSTLFACVAQMAERRFCNSDVAGSIPAASSNFFSGHKARTRNSISTPRGMESRNMVLRVSPSKEVRKQDDVFCFVRHALARREFSSLRQLAVRGVKTTGSFLFSPSPGKGDGEDFSDAFQFVLHDVSIVTHGVSNVVPFPQTVVK